MGLWEGGRGTLRGGLEGQGGGQDTLVCCLVVRGGLYWRMDLGGIGHNQRRAGGWEIPRKGDGFGDEVEERIAGWGVGWAHPEESKDDNIGSK